MITLIALKGFATDDAGWPLKVSQGDEFQAREYTAKRLILSGYARKKRAYKKKPKKKELKNG